MIEKEKIEDLKKGLIVYVQQITEESRKGGRNHYICPLPSCGSGKGKNHSGAFSITEDGTGWKCFSCGKGGDIFKLIELYEGITDFKSQVKRAEEVTGIRTDPERLQARKRKEAAADPEKKQKGKYKEYINRCRAAAGETDYFISRGFTDEIVKRFWLGYDKEERSIVIPYGKGGSYFIRRSVSGKFFYKPKRSEAGEEPIYNSAALFSDNRPCFITESAIDAISIMAASGAKAAAIGGAGYRKLIKEFEKRKPAGVLILSFDNDEPGKRIEKEAAEELDRIGVEYIKAAYTWEEYPKEARKDANDLFRSNRAQFIEDLRNNTLKAEKALEAKIEALRGEIKKHSAENFIENVIGSGSGKLAIKTGFESFDEKLGGLYPGLYILGAISSMGKTSYMLQLADQIAESGRGVLFFTLEMGAKELIARSLSRYSFLAAGKIDREAATTRSIEAGRFYNDEQHANTKKGAENYKEAAKNIYYFESLGEIGAEEIRAEVERYIDVMEDVPAVFVDYLQIMKPYNEKWTEKRNTDKTITELRKIARDFNITVFAVSSLNRGSYKGDIDMEAFKESGAIEYGSDVLLALQTPGLESGFTPKEAKANKETIENEKKKTARELEIKVLKNRSGSTGQRIRFIYNAKFNYFEEDKRLDVAALGFVPTGVIEDVF